MSEEEIIRKCNWFIKNDVMYEQSLYDAIQGLLDLYQKEKRLNAQIRELIDKRGNNGYTSLDCVNDIEELLEERN